MDEMLKQILDKLGALEDGQKAMQADIKEVKSDVKHMRDQVDVLYSWVDKNDLRLNVVEETLKIK